MEKNDAPVQNKMGTMPVPKLIINMGLPMMLSMVVQALYNVVDTFFVSNMADTATIVNMGDKAINALTIAFPIQLLMIALGCGTGVGINASLSKALGEKDNIGAGKIAGNAVFLGLAYSVVMTLFGVFGARAFIATQTTDAVVAELGTTYLRIVTLLSFTGLMYLDFEKILQATGNAFATTIAQIAGAVSNMILDPIMIYGKLGLPAMGVAGAAWATVIGQFISMAIMLYMLIRHTPDIKILPKYILPKKKLIGSIYAVGAPAIVMQVLSPIMSYFLNLILGSVTEAAITAYGVYYKLQNFILMAVYGMNNAFLPIISFNYGAKDRKRIGDTVKYSLIFVTCILLFGVLLLQVFARPITSAFSLSDEAADICVMAMRIITCGFVFIGCNVLLQGLCQSLGNGIYSLIVSAVRMIVVILPLAWFLSTLPGAENLVWIAFPVAECVGFIVSVILAKRIYKQRVVPFGL